MRTRLASALALLLLTTAPARADYRLAATSPEQDATLAAVTSRAGAGKVVIFDLDSTVLDNRPRQVAILRAWAAREGLTALEGLAPEHFQDWSLERTLRRAGIGPAGRKELVKRASAAWRAEFWDPAALIHDVAIPGAARFARALHARGATLAYVGRRTAQAEGTRATLRRFGFPLGERASLLLADVEGRDEKNAAWRATLEQAAGLGEVVAAFENEGPKVDALRERFPQAIVAHVRTDGPRFLRSNTGPHLQGFLRSDDRLPALLPPPLDVPAAGAPLTVAKVSDGDTLTVRDAAGEESVVRLIGVDTPEKDGLYRMESMADKRRRHLEAYGPKVVDTPGSWKVAQEALRALVEGREVFLRYDDGNAEAGHRDSTTSGRVLAYVFARGEGEALVDVNAEMCRRGMTLDYGYRYPHSRAVEFRALIGEARAAGRGYFAPEFQAGAAAGH